MGTGFGRWVVIRSISLLMELFYQHVISGLESTIVRFLGSWFNRLTGILLWEIILGPLLFILPITFFFLHRRLNMNGP